SLVCRGFDSLQHHYLIERGIFHPYSQKNDASHEITSSDKSKRAQHTACPIIEMPNDVRTDKSSYLANGVNKSETGCSRGFGQDHRRNGPKCWQVGERQPGPQDEKRERQRETSCPC